MMKNNIFKQLLCIFLICSFIIPQMPITVSATNRETYFQDIPESQWYADAVRYVYNNKLMSGITDTTFAPASNVTRAMFVTVLGRMDGVDVKSYTGNSFKDVPEGQWYSAYVEWAVQNEIVSGYSAEIFGLNDYITREQMATIIYRYVNFKEISLRDSDTAVDGFIDEKYVSAWAKAGLDLMRRTGIIKGNSDGRFNPLNTANRAEAATVFMKLHSLIVGADWISIKYNALPTVENIVYDDSEHVYYANNMLLITFNNTASSLEIKSVIDSVQGTIVGRMVKLDTYQVRLPEEYTLDELENLGNYLMDSYNCIAYATYDSAVPVINDAVKGYEPKDPWNDDVYGADWKDEDADDSNWWIEAIDAQYAWAYNKCFAKINIGISDSSFDIGHEDLKNKCAFANDVLKERNQTVITSPKIEDEFHYHGTHVAGIIGAEANNEKGITGLVWNSKLLLAPLYALPNAEQYLWWDSSLYANLTYLVEAGAKVVNYSQGKTNFLTASNPAFSDEFIRREGNMAAYFMAKLLDRNYDFIVVQSAGNGRGDSGTAVDALQNGLFCSITESSYTCSDITDINDVLNRVIIVGAAEQNGNGYRCTSFSNYGDKVDICAPGQDIYSTVPGDTFWGFEVFGGYSSQSGTSMAAPIVSGVCGMVWAADSKLTGAQVKEIVCNNTDTIVAASPESASSQSYNMVNAHLAVQEAVYMDYLRSKEYKSYTDEWYEKPVEYSILDINQDGIPELIINSKTSMGWFNTMMCTYDTQKDKVIVMEDVYNWSGVRYSERFKTLTYSEMRYTVAGGFGGQQFYTIENNKLKESYFVGYDFNVSDDYYFISINGNDDRILKSTYDFYYEDVKHIEYEPLSDI